jgi:hypothetical protein
MFFQMICLECLLRDIEFRIELQPGTAPVAKSPYKMTREELAELKI